MPGWDCHGLPIELKALEKVEHQIQDHKGLKDIDVRNAARKLATRAVAQQMKGFQSWGIMADFYSHWKTMDKDFEIKQLKVFREMAMYIGLRRRKPLLRKQSSSTMTTMSLRQHIRITKLSDASRGKL